jgi:Undecaprenyl-phosphate galactose phosphotransferase WbaP
MSTKTLISQPGVADFTRSTVAYSPSASLCLLLADFIGVSVVFWLAVWSKYLVYPTLDFRFYLELFPAVVIFLVGFSSQGLYPAMLIHPAEEMRRVFHSVTAVILVLVSVTFLMKDGADYSRYIILLSWLLLTPAVLLCRTLTRKLLSRMVWWPVPAIVLGSGPDAEQVVRSLQDTQRGLRITGVLLDHPVAAWDPDLPPIIGHLSDAPLITRQSSVRYGILAMPDGSHAEIRQTIQDHCRGFSRILIITDLIGICCLGIHPREIGGQVGLEIPQRLSYVVPKMMKRCLDVVVATVLMILLMPLFLIICIAIKVNSRGPVLFGHLRYGRDGKAFQALKFRTMVTNADQILGDYLRNHPDQMLEWQISHKLKNDPRITGVGRSLRRYSLDELPQLLNILAGHMSLVGPRPIVRSEIPRYAASYDLYTRVSPGLTGLWQVSGRNNTTYAERVAFDESLQFRQTKT